MKKISWVVLFTMLCALIIPVSGFALTLNDVSFVKVDNEYFYEDFAKYTGSNITSDCNETSIGYYTGNATSLKKDESNGTAALGFSYYADSSAAAITGPRGGHDSTYNIFKFNINKTAFEDANKTLVFSYDAYVPYYTGSKQTLYSFIGYADNGDMNYLKYMAAGAKLVKLSNVQKFMGFDKEATARSQSNEIASLYDSESVIGANITQQNSGRWVNLQTVMQYDSTNKQYISWNYVDGQPIINKTGEIAKLKFKPDTTILDSIQKRNSIAFSINARCDAASNTEKNKDIIVDNVALYLYNTTSVGNGTVSGKTITIPVANTQSFTDAQNAPEVVKKGYLNVDTANSAKLTTESGTEITGAKITATPSEIKITAPASVGNGDKVKVNLTGVKDIAGNQIGLDSSVYTINGYVNAANKQYLQDFEGITELSEVGFNPGNMSQADTTKTYVLGSTTDKGKGLAVNYAAGSSTKSIVAPGADTTYGFSVDAASFETAGKEIEYGYDVYIPAGAFKGEALAGYLVLAKESGDVIQYCSELPWLTNTDNTTPNLKIRAISAESVQADWTNSNNDKFTANGKPGVDQANSSVYVDYAETENGGWVSVKSRLSYVKDSNGTGYYMTKYYINNEVMRTDDGTPAIFKIQENLAPASSGRKYLQFSLWGNNGENNPDKLIVDNIFAKVVDAEDGELTVYDIEGDNGTYSFVYNNLSTSAKPYQFIIAGYDKTTGKLLSVDISKNGEFAARSTGTISSTLTSSEEITEYKVFLWNNFTELKPLKKNLVD